jgi:hypothetical protein
MSSVLKQQAAQALATYLTAQTGVPFTAVAADYEQDATFPSGVVIPRRGQFTAWQDDEMDTTSTKQLVTVGEFEGQVEIRLAGLEQPAREVLEQQVMDVLAASEFSPGVVTLQAPAVNVMGTQFTHQPLVVFSLTEEDWREEMVFTSERYASLTLDAWYHVFVARDYPDMNEILVALGQDVTATDATTIAVEVVKVQCLKGRILERAPRYFFLFNDPDIITNQESNLGSGPADKITWSGNLRTPSVVPNVDTQGVYLGPGANGYGQANFAPPTGRSPCRMAYWLTPTDLNTVTPDYNGIGWQAGLRIAVASDGSVKAFVDNGVALVSSPAGAVRPGQLYMLGIRFDGDTLELYVNGAKVGQAAVSGVVSRSGTWFASIVEANGSFQYWWYEDDPGTAAMMATDYATGLNALASINH